MNILEKIDFLLEVTNKVESQISDEEAEKILETKCFKNFREGPILFRGNWNLRNKYYHFTGNYTRKSANTTNHYTKLFSEELSSWSAYPKRNKSLICTTYKNGAAAFGNVYQIIPYDSSKPFGAAGESDFWDIIYDNPYWKALNILSLNELNDVLEEIFGNDREFASNLKRNSIKEVIRILPENLSKYAKDLVFCALWYEGKSVNQAKDLTQEYINGNSSVISQKTLSTNFLEILNKILAPQNTSVKLLQSFSSIKSTPGEIWFDTPAIMKRVD